MCNFHLLSPIAALSDITDYKDYATYLKYIYKTSDQISSVHDQWPPPATKKFFRLAMIESLPLEESKIKDEFVLLTITGKVDDILHHKTPIELKDIFTKTNAKQKKVLIEGAPGCGKSTLSVHICQQWAAGQLFQEYTLVILVKLRDPVIQNCRSMADLLPRCDEQMGKNIEELIMTTKGRDVLFILDGWDELPQSAPAYSFILKLTKACNSLDDQYINNECEAESDGDDIFNESKPAVSESSGGLDRSESVLVIPISHATHLPSDIETERDISILDEVPESASDPVIPTSYATHLSSDTESEGDGSILDQVPESASDQCETDELDAPVEHGSEIPEVSRLVGIEDMFVESSVIITSRPTRSGILHPLVSTRIEVLGFTKCELRQYFTGCLQEDTKAVESLLQKIKANPIVEGTCYLPLNASILVHLFKSEGNELPTTQIGIFSALICNCISRHLMKSMQEIYVIESLEKLPLIVVDAFEHLCELAYNGVMNGKIIFELDSSFNTLGLLQGVQSFAIQGSSHSYNFLHLSIQELLAAIYLATKVKAEDQIDELKCLICHPHFSAVFEFYAAMTKLKAPGIVEIVMQAAELDKFDLVSLLHCLFEAQDISLYQAVSDKLNSRLDLGHVSLTRSDNFVISCFLAYPGVHLVFLNGCGIDDDGCKLLFKQDESYDFRSLRYVPCSV